MTNMGRPHKYRKLSGTCPEYNFYHPHGLSAEEESIMTMHLSAEEFEALYLRHYDNLKQTDAADKMAISQTTYSRILSRAYEKLTKAFVEGFAISFQTHPLQEECPHAPPHRKRFGRTNIPSYPANSEPYSPQVVFSGFGCQVCGYEWAVIDEASQPKKDKPNCPECNSTKTFRLIKKLTPETPET